jgi:hypothetical protein
MRGFLPENKMKLSQMVAAYARNPRAKAKLKQRIELDNGDVLEAGIVSELLISKGDGKYHFEADHTACTVTEDEIEFL